MGVSWTQRKERSGSCEENDGEKAAAWEQGKVWGYLCSGRGEHGRGGERKNCELGKAGRPGLARKSGRGGAWLGQPGNIIVHGLVSKCSRSTESKAMASAVKWGSVEGRRAVI